MVKFMWKWMLEKVMNYMVGKDVFGQVKKMVEEVGLNKELTGAQKKEKVLEQAKGMGEDFASSMMNFAVEAAVTMLKEQQKKIS